MSGLGSRVSAQPEECEAGAFLVLDARDAPDAHNVGFAVDLQRFLAGQGGRAQQV